MQALRGFPEAIRAMREAAGLSQAALAERAGTTQGMVSRYERGDAQPELGTLERILQAMGKGLADLDDEIRVVRGEAPRQNHSAPHSDAPPEVNMVADELIRSELIQREVDRRIADIMTRMVQQLGKSREEEAEDAEPATG